MPITDEADRMVFETNSAQKSGQSSQTQVLLDSQEELIMTPSQDCGWAIHLLNPCLALGLAPFSNYPPNRDNEAPSETGPFQEDLRAALATDSFTEIPSVSLAVPLSELASKVSRSENDFRAETISFAIMGRNLDLLVRSLIEVFEIVDDVQSRGTRQLVLDMGLDWTSLLHIATSYLDGGNTCCLIVAELAKFAITFSNPWTGGLINPNGHTLIDNIFLTILRSHADVPLSTVDSKVGKSARYSGQEVDICGRWDATSPCFRTLLASGQTQIPVSWKHKFCRTSAQAVCHSLAILLRNFPFLQTADSGLFSQRCTNSMCGGLFTLGPLHALVMTSFNLMMFGGPEEDLFGMLACFLSLIDAGVDPLQCMDVSVQQMLGTVTTEDCSHNSLTAAELARNVYQELWRWPLSDTCLTGFAALVSVMEETERARRHYVTTREESSEELDEPYMCDTVESDHVLAESSFTDCVGVRGGYLCMDCRDGEDPVFGDSWQLGHVWAAVQAEMASGQLRAAGDSSSDSFSMKRLLQTMTDNILPDLAHLEPGNLREYCKCGKFSQANPGLANMDEIFKDTSRNLNVNEETWARISIIKAMDLGDEYFDSVL